MYSTIQRKFESAVDSGDLVFTETTSESTKWNGIDIVYTLAPALSKKAGKDDMKKQVDPWNPPDEALLIEKGETHSVVLNKFAIAKYHFLVVTNEFQSQISPLNESDWKAAMATLKSANSESGKRHVGFFNSGENSGASVAHKHIQIMTLPESYTPFPDNVAQPEPSKTTAVTVTNEPKIPFSHFLAFIPKDAGEDDFMVTYYELMTRVFTVLGRHQANRSFNVVFTEEWILVTPRKQEKSEGISINSLGTIGLILAKNDEQLKIIKEKGFDLIKNLGFENDGSAEYSSSIDTHIQY